MAGVIRNPLALWVGGAGAVQDTPGQRVPLPGILGRMAASPPVAGGYVSLLAPWVGGAGMESVVANRFVLTPSTMALTGTTTVSQTGWVLRWTLDLDPGVDITLTGTVGLSGSISYTSHAAFAGYTGLLGFWAGGGSAYNPVTLTASDMALTGTLGLSGDVRLGTPPVVVITGAGSKRGRRRAYVATHKGRDYVFETMEEAQNFLQSVREIVKKKRGRPAKPKIVNIPVSVMESSDSIKVPDMSIIMPKRYFSPQEAEIALQALREEMEDEDEVLILLGVL